MFRNLPNTVRLADVLHGCTPGRIQSVGYMQVVPLVSDLTDDRFVSPVEGGAEVSTSNYGTLEFRNPSDRVLIVPCNAGFVVKQAAQDHAMSHTGVVGASKERKFSTAMCVQQSQGGLIAKGAHRLLILPHALRESALENRVKKEYSKLWADIAAFNRSVGAPARGDLVAFLTRFAKELDEFVAEFECVPNQIGAVILVDDQVVGVERAPSHAYWRSVWPALIRECYGSLAIQFAQAKGETAEVPASRMPLPEVDSLEDLATAIADVAHEEDERTKTTVRELLDVELRLVRDEKTCGLRVETVESERFGGQVVRDGERIVYASLPVTTRAIADGRWRASEPFTI